MTEENEQADRMQMKQQVLERIYRMVGEREQVIAKRQSLRDIMNNAACEITDEARAGMVLLENAMHEGLKDVDALIVEALGLLAGLDDGEVPNDRS